MNPQLEEVLIKNDLYFNSFKEIYVDTKYELNLKKINSKITLYEQFYRHHGVKLTRFLTGEFIGILLPLLSIGIEIKKNLSIGSSIELPNLGIAQLEKYDQNKFRDLNTTTLFGIYQKKASAKSTIIGGVFRPKTIFIPNRPDIIV